MNPDEKADFSRSSMHLETERERESSHVSRRVGGWGETETVFSRVSSYKALIPS